MTASMTRKNSLTLLASAPTLGALGLFAGSAKAANEPVGQLAKSSDAVTAAEFADRVFDDTARMLCGALGYIGDRLQLFKAIEQLGKCTPTRPQRSLACMIRWPTAALLSGR